LDDAAVSARHGLKCARDAQVRRTLVRCLNVLALCHWQQGRNVEAQRILEQSLRHARTLHDGRAETTALGNLASVEKALGRYERARVLMLEVLERQRELGDWIGVVVRLNDLAALHQARQEWAPALGYLQEGLALSERHALAFVRPHLLVNLALLSFFDGRLDDAERIGRQVLDEGRAAANRQVEATALLHLVRVAVKRGRLAEARALLCEAIALTTATQIVPMQLDAVFCFAEILAAAGDGHDAAALFRYYIERPDLEPGDRALGEAGLVGLPEATAPDTPLPALLAQILLRAQAMDAAAQAR
jgi:hypothetical protein